VYVPSMRACVIACVVALSHSVNYYYELAVEIGGDTMNLVQEWVRQLPEMDDETQYHVCACLRQELVDVEVLVEMTSSDFDRLGLCKVRYLLTKLR